MKYAAILSALLLPTLAATSTASAEESFSRGTYINVDPSTVDLWTPEQGPAGNVLFLNRCPGGCIINVGNNSSLNNSSSIIFSTSALSEWSHGDDAWDNLVECVQGVFEPFNITVTDQAPSGSHHEVMVAGVTSEFNNPNISNALGVSPATCGVINNSLTFVFANVTSSIPDICWAVAQEPGHSWGLDHQMLCEDPMTYLTECGPNKYAFQNTQAPCGEDRNRQCNCGGSTQNSHARIAQIFGTDGGDPPEMTIVRPTEGQLVRPNFPIEVQVTDVSPIGPVEVLIDGQVVGSSEFQPYVFNAPEDLDFGTYTVEVRATDVHGATGTSSVTVEVSEDAPEDPDNPGGGGGDDSGGCQAGGGTSGILGAFAVVLIVGLRRRRR